MIAGSLDRASEWLDPKNWMVPARGRRMGIGDALLVFQYGESATSIARAAAEALTVRS